MKAINNLTAEQIKQVLALKEQKKELQAVALEVEPSAFSKTSLGSLAHGALSAIPGGVKIGSALSAGIKKLENPDIPYKYLYKDTLDKARRNELEAQKSNPWTNFAGNIVGSAGLPGLKGAGLGKAALEGAGYGALHGLGNQDSGDALSLDLNDALATASGAGIGGLTGGASKYIANKATPFVHKGKDYLINKVGEEHPIATSLKYLLGETPRPNEDLLERMSLAEKYNFPLSKGQLGKNLKDIVHEGEAGRGKLGESNMKKIQEFKENQKLKFNEIATGLRDKIADEPYTTKGENIGEPVRNIVHKYNKEKMPVDLAYEEARSKVQPFFGVELKEFPEMVKTKFENNIWTKDNHPLAFAEIKSLQDTIKHKGKAGVIPIQALEGWRQGINQTIKKAPDSQRASLSQLVKEYDEFMDAKIENALIKNDVDVLEQFKKARKLASDLFKKYAPSNSKNVGKNFIKDMIEHERLTGETYTNEEIVNKIFGLENMGFKSSTIHIIKELESHLPVNEMNFIRQEAAHRLLEPLFKESGNPAVITQINNLEKVIKKHPTTMKYLFGEDWLKQAKEIGKLGIDAFTVPKYPENPPSTALVKDLLEKNSWTKALLPLTESNISKTNLNKDNFKKDMLKPVFDETSLSLPAKAITRATANSLIDGNTQDRINELSADQIKRILEFKKSQASEAKP